MTTKMWKEMEFNEMVDDVTRDALSALLTKGGVGLKNIIRSALLDASVTRLESRPKMKITEEPVL